MEFNVDKCKVMHIGGRDDNSTYYMEGNELTKVSCEKDLGVWIFYWENMLFVVEVVVLSVER